jgi:Meiotically Up-regulated Gene 113 (MUG113) protein
MQHSQGRNLLARSDGKVWCYDSKGVLRLLSQEEANAIHEQRCKKYEQYKKEVIAAWPQQQVEVIQSLLKFLLLCQKTPAEDRRSQLQWCFPEARKEHPEEKPSRSCLRCCAQEFVSKLLEFDHPDPRYQIIGSRTFQVFLNQLRPYSSRARLRPCRGRASHPCLLDCCVYLMWCPTLGTYKIGWTDNLNQRILQHQKDLDAKIELRSVYYTPLFLRRNKCPLEWFIHSHFGHFRVQSDLSDELFDLPKKDADGFMDVVKEIEHYLLAIEIMRLKSLLSKFKAEC